MLLPIGQEENQVRRQPWVSYGLIGLNLAVFLLLLPLRPGPQWEREFEGGWAEMIDYLRERPYLELPPILADRCGEVCRAQLEEMREERRRQGELPVGSVVQEQQRSLDARVQEVMDLLDQLPSYRWGYVPARPSLFSLLASMFVHGGWLHLLGNLLFLYVSGPFLEDRYGRPLFAGLYLFSGLVAVLTHAANSPGSAVPLVGASGAIAGVMGAFLIRLATRRIRFLFMPLFPFPLVRFTFHLPAFMVLPLWFGEQFWYANRSGGTSDVAWWAHVGGFCFGVGVALLVKLTGIEEKVISPAIEQQISFTQHPGIERARGFRVRGQLDPARTAIESMLAEEPRNLDAWQEAYEIAVEAGDGAWASSSALRLLELFAEQNEPELLAALIPDALERVGTKLPARFYASAASQAERAGELQAALLAYHTFIDRNPADASVLRACFRSGQIQRRLGETAAARKAFERVQAHPACSEELRQAAERALAELKNPTRP